MTGFTRSIWRIPGPGRTAAAQLIVCPDCYRTEAEGHKADCLVSAREAAIVALQAEVERLRNVIVIDFGNA